MGEAKRRREWREAHAPELAADLARRRHAFATIEALACGEAPPTPLPDYEALIAAWHDGAGEGQELHGYLGMTWEQYKAWVEQPWRL